MIPSRKWHKTAFLRAPVCRPIIPATNCAAQFPVYMIASAYPSVIEKCTMMMCHVCKSQSQLGVSLLHRKNTAANFKQNHVSELQTRSKNCRGSVPICSVDHCIG